MPPFCRPLLPAPHLIHADDQRDDGRDDEHDERRVVEGAEEDAQPGLWGRFFQLQHQRRRQMAGARQSRLSEPSTRPMPLLPPDLVRPEILLPRLHLGCRDTAKQAPTHAHSSLISVCPPAALSAPPRLTPSLRRPSAPRAAIAPHPDASAPRRSQWSVQLSRTWAIPENGGQDMGPLPEAPKTCVMILTDACVLPAFASTTTGPHLRSRPSCL